MADRIIHTIKGLDGSLMHFDENGQMVGQSVPSVFGDGYTTFGPDGSLLGTSMRSCFGDSLIHTAADGSYAGTTMKGLFGMDYTVDGDGNGFANLGDSLFDD